MIYIGIDTILGRLPHLDRLYIIMNNLSIYIDTYIIRSQKSVIKTYHDSQYSITSLLLQLIVYIYMLCSCCNVQSLIIINCHFGSYYAHFCCFSVKLLVTKITGNNSLILKIPLTYKTIAVNYLGSERRLIQLQQWKEYYQRCYLVQKFWSGLIIIWYLTAYFQAKWGKKKIQIAL